jgi:DNA-binding SARP family transcriptional activator
MSLLEEQREYASAIAHVRHWLQHDPLDEEAYRRLMRLLALAGDRMAALQAYLQCKGALQRELAAQPSAETVRTFERIRGAELGPQVSTERREGNLAASALVGRQAEWARARGRSHGDESLFRRPECRGKLRDTSRRDARGAVSPRQRPRRPSRGGDPVVDQ